METEVTTRGLMLAIATCLIALIVGNFAAGVLRPAPPPNSYDAPRNPHFRRDWVRWTRPPATLPDARRMVVISNSQGFLRERPEGELCYTARLEELVAERTDAPAEALNWSIPGGKIPEMTVLAARAAAHDPTDIVLVTYTENLVGESMRTRLSFGISDAPLLTALSEVRELLSDEFQSRFDVGNVAPYTSVYTGYGAFRWKTVEGADEDWYWRKKEPDLDLSTLEKTVDPWDDDSSWALREFVETARRAAPNATIHVIEMPLPKPAWTPEAWAIHQEMATNARAALEGFQGVQIHDALTLIPPDQFYTHTHFRAEGHETFARWLADRILGDGLDTGSAG